MPGSKGPTPPLTPQMQSIMDEIVFEAPAAAPVKSVTIVSPKHQQRAAAPAASPPVKPGEAAAAQERANEKVVESSSSFRAMKWKRSTRKMAMR